MVFDSQTKGVCLALTDRSGSRQGIDCMRRSNTELGSKSTSDMVRYLDRLVSRSPSKQIFAQSYEDLNTLDSAVCEYLHVSFEHE